MNNILLTGHSGFLGSHIKSYLNSKGYSIIKLGRNNNSDIICDLGNETFSSENLDYIIHAAGKAHVTPKTQEEIDEFYKVNYQGTRNLIKSVSNMNIKAFVFISTVAVYGKERGVLIDESSPLLGNTPYALSKINAEQAIIEYGKKNKVNVVILRLPLITGKNPVGNLKGIINTIKRGYYFRIGSGDAKRSIVAASDVAEVMPELFNLEGIYNFTDCIHPKISEIDTVIAKKYHKKVKTFPLPFMKLVSSLGELFSFFPFNKSKFDKLTNTLTFSNKKILKEIDFKPVKGISETISSF